MSLALPWEGGQCQWARPSWLEVTSWLNYPANSSCSDSNTATERVEFILIALNYNVLTLHKSLYSPNIFQFEDPSHRRRLVTFSHNSNCSVCGNSPRGHGPQAGTQMNPGKSTSSKALLSIGTCSSPGDMWRLEPFSCLDPVRLWAVTCFIHE